LARLHALFVHRTSPSFSFSLPLRLSFSFSLSLPLPLSSFFFFLSSFYSLSFSAFVRCRTCRPSFSTSRSFFHRRDSCATRFVCFLERRVVSCCIASPSLTVVPLRLLSRLFFASTRPRFVKQTRPRFAETALCRDFTDSLSTPRGLTTFISFHSRSLIQLLFLYQFYSKFVQI